MITRTPRLHTVFFAAFAIAATVFVAGNAMGQDAYSPGSTTPAVNPYSELGFQDQGSELVDAIDRAYPASTSGTFNNASLLSEGGDSSTAIADKVDAISPVNTTGTMDIPSLQVPDDMIGSEALVDRVDSVNERMGNR